MNNWEGVRKHRFFVCKNKYVGNLSQKSMFYVGNTGWSWNRWDKVFGKVCWKGMSEMRTVRWKMLERCNVAIMGADMM